MINLLTNSSSVGDVGPVASFSEKLQTFTALSIPSSNYATPGGNGFIVALDVASSTSPITWAHIASVGTDGIAFSSVACAGSVTFSGVYVAMRARLIEASGDSVEGSVSVKLFVD